MRFYKREKIQNIKKNYGRFVLKSKIDFLFHILFGFLFTYLSLIIIDFLEILFRLRLNIFNTNEIWYFIGIGIVIFFTVFYQYKMFNKLDDIHEMHNQLALVFGDILALCVFVGLGVLALDINYLFLDIPILFLSLIFNIFLFSKFWNSFFRILFFFK